MLNKSILALSFLSIFVILGFRYHQYIISENFILYLNGPCDVSIESCFVWDCDILDPECDASPYKKIEIIAKDAPACLEEHVCEEFSCNGLDNCRATYCSEDTLEEEERCAQRLTQFAE